jgi:hypothetical protein
MADSYYNRIVQASSADVLAMKALDSIKNGESKLHAYKQWRFDVSHKDQNEQTTLIPEHKRQHGQYFTKGNCFEFKPFAEWFVSIPNHKKIVIAEPFAGSGDIPKLMLEAGYKNKFVQYDIDPKNHRVSKRDSISNPPVSECVITNPPYLAKNSATRRGLEYPDTIYDDLYKLALSKILESCPYVAAIIPESFITSGLFLDRVDKIISIKMKMFDDTECPVCLALFSPNTNGVKIYDEEVFVGDLSDLKKYLPNPTRSYDWKFNDPSGEIGIVAIDNNKTSTIRFVFGNKIDPEEVKTTSRSKTRVSVTGNHNNTKKIITRCNKILEEMRENTSDVFLTAFKGIREDGKYRRRLDFEMARAILNSAMGDI